MPNPEGPPPGFPLPEKGQQLLLPNKIMLLFSKSPVMEKQHGKDFHPEPGQGSLLPLLDHKHLKSIISFRVESDDVGAAFSRDGVGCGREVCSAKAHSRAIDSIE